MSHSTALLEKNINKRNSYLMSEFQINLLRFCKKLAKKFQKNCKTYAKNLQNFCKKLLQLHILQNVLHNAALDF